MVDSVGPAVINTATFSVSNRNTTENSSETQAVQSGQAAQNVTPQAAPEQSSAALRLDTEDNQLAALRSELSELNSDNAADLNLDPTSGDRGADGILTDVQGQTPGGLIDISV